MILATISPRSHPSTQGCILLTWSKPPPPNETPYSPQMHQHILKTLISLENSHQQYNANAG